MELSKYDEQGNIQEQWQIWLEIQKCKDFLCLGYHKLYVGVVKVWVANCLLLQGFFSNLTLDCFAYKLLST